MLKDLSFPITMPSRTSKLGLDFPLQSVVYSLKSEDWSVNLATLWSCESDSIYNHAPLEATGQSESDC